jgi:prophage maintenance system killer protein
MAVILKNNKPRYMVLSFSEYDEIQAARAKFISTAADNVIAENGEELYPGVIEKAARLAFGICANHPLGNGNRF